MARPKSENRRSALLDAAAEVFAEHGLAAPTSLISKTAGVSEGSLFTYFPTKDELIVALYVEIRLAVAAAVMNDFPRRSGVRERLEHIWNGFVSWGAANPAHRRALKHINMSKAVAGVNRPESDAMFAEVDRLYADADDQGKLKVSRTMASAALKALSEMTMDLVAKSPDQAVSVKADGFRMLWGALTAK